jgi:replication factor A1
MLDLLGVVTSVGPSSTVTRKNGVKASKRVLQLKDMSGCSVETTFWGNFCDAEGQQLQLLCDSGSSPILALKSGRICDFNGRSVATISASCLKINPDGPEAERLRQWYLTEGKNAAVTSLSVGMSSMGRTDVRTTIAQIKEEGMGKSEKPDWITVMGTVWNIKTDNFCYPACTGVVNGTRCTKKVTKDVDEMWQCESCEQSSQNCEYRYMLPCQIQDHTGSTTYATAFQDALYQRAVRGPAQQRPLET